MAMEKCIQVSTVCSNARVSGLFSSKERPHLQRFIRAPPAMRLLNSTLSFSSSSSAPHSLSRRCANSRIVCKSSVGEVEAVTDSSWNEKVVGSTTPVLVEFWAPWCGPCRMIAPVVDELAKEYSGKVSCYKVNTDDCPDIASRYGIRSIPTVLFFKNGEKKESVIGAVPKSTLTATLDKYLDI